MKSYKAIIGSIILAAALPTGVFAAENNTAEPQEKYILPGRQLVRHKPESQAGNWQFVTFHAGDCLAWICPAL